MTATSPTIDVVVATRDRPDDLRRLLPTLAAQRDVTFRVLVIDQSDDSSANSAAISVLADQRFRHLPTATRGRSFALNEALEHCDAPVIAFTDDDCEVAPDWLSLISKSVARHPEAGIIFGQLLPAEHDPETTFVPAIEIKAERVWDRPLLRSHGLLGMGASMVIPRATFDCVGLFDTELGAGGVLRSGEECELTYRCLNAGLPIVQDPSIQVIHWGFRAWEGGVADRLLADGFFGTMAGHGKHVRQGDWRAMSVTLHEAATNAWLVVSSMARRRRPFHVRHFELLVRGFWAGFRRGPSWPPAPGAAR